MLVAGGVVASAARLDRPGGGSGEHYAVPLQEPHPGRYAGRQHAPSLGLQGEPNGRACRPRLGGSRVEQYGTTLNGSVRVARD